MIPVSKDRTTGNQKPFSVYCLVPGAVSNGHMGLGEMGIGR